MTAFKLKIGEWYWCNLDGRMVNARLEAMDDEMCTFWRILGKFAIEHSRIIRPSDPPWYMEENNANL